MGDCGAMWIESTECAQNDDRIRGANCLMFGPYGHCTRSNLYSKNCRAVEQEVLMSERSNSSVLARIEQLELKLGIRASIGIYFLGIEENANDVKPRVSLSSLLSMVAD